MVCDRQFVIVPGVFVIKLVATQLLVKFWAGDRHKEKNIRHVSGGSGVLREELVFLLDT